VCGKATLFRGDDKSTAALPRTGAAQPQEIRDDYGAAELLRTPIGIAGEKTRVSAAFENITDSFYRIRVGTSTARAAA